MFDLRRFLSFGSITAALALGLLPRPALALQPLQQFVDASRHHAPDLLEQRANQAQAEAQADVALGRALPGLSARGTYTRNQYDAVVNFPANGTIQKLTLVPFNQLDAFVTLSVPLVDLASFKRIGAARTGAEAAGKQTEASRLGVESQVAQSYFQLVANLALVEASNRALDVARESQKLSKTRVELGRAPALELDRADAEVERNVQLVAGAQLQVAVAARALEAVSGIAPDLASPPKLDDDLHPEPAVEGFVPGPEGTPALAAAAAARKVQEELDVAQHLQLFPTLSASVTEHASNASSFSGKNASYQAVLALNWYLDYSLIASLRAQEAAVAAAKAREQRAQSQVSDAVKNAWSAVEASIARGRSARAQEKAAQHAAMLARERYEAGAAAQLDLLQAERDAFGAEVARIQADADLANARTQLRLAAGRDPFASTSGETK